MSNKVNALSSLLLWFFVGAGVVLDRWYGIVFIGNIAIFIVWGFTIGSFLALFADNKDFNKVKKSKNRMVRYTYFAVLIVIISAGWFTTAIFSLLGWIFLYVKIDFDKKEINEN